MGDEGEERRLAAMRVEVLAEGTLPRAGAQDVALTAQWVQSNESFGGWTKTFTDPRLCVAVVECLTCNGTIIETDTDSHRLASTRHELRSRRRPAELRATRHTVSSW
ncbi:hypothetical protein GCM10010270_79100 [Streptomyces violaceus]|nr:hypothetical protein GCM10010270_79100 [Streptomyces janthinus]